MAFPEIIHSAPGEKKRTQRPRPYILTEASFFPATTSLYFISSKHKRTYVQSLYWTCIPGKKMTARETSKKFPLILSSSGSRERPPDCHSLSRPYKIFRSVCARKWIFLPSSNVCIYVRWPVCELCTKESGETLVEKSEARLLMRLIFSLSLRIIVCIRPRC